MRRILILLAFATLAGALVFGAAAALNVSSNNLGSGADVVASCDTDGVSVSYEVDAADPTLVSAVTVSGIAAACDTQAIHVAVTDGTNVLATGNGVVSEAVTPGSETITLDASADASAITEAAVTITG